MDDNTPPAPPPTRRKPEHFKFTKEHAQDSARQPLSDENREAIDDIKKWQKQMQAKNPPVNNAIFSFQAVELQRYHINLKAPVMQAVNKR